MAEWTYKIIFLGTSGAGKSSFIGNLLNKLDNYSSYTFIGVNIYSFTVKTSENNECQLQIWDIKQQFYSTEQILNYCKAADAAFIFFDASDIRSFYDIPHWINLIYRSKEYNKNFRCFIIGAKIDLGLNIDESEIENMVEQFGLDGYFLISNLEDKMHKLIIEKMASMLMRDYVIDFNEIDINGLIGDDGIVRIPDELRDHSAMPVYMRGKMVRPEKTDDFFSYTSWDSFFVNPRTSIYENNNDGDFLDPETLRNLINILEESFNLKHGELTTEKEKELNELIKIFSRCPLCGVRNHAEYLVLFYFSKNPEVIAIKNQLLNILKEYDISKLFFKYKITIGVPCCNCFVKFYGYDPFF
ncbi:MAG: ADP-ribosylation factor-like protein [Candidatus Helarchaeota archaeon]